MPSTPQPLNKIPRLRLGAGSELAQCADIVDIRCNRPQHPFHRIIDCLLPVWLSITGAAKRTPFGMLCLIGTTRLRSSGVDAYIAALLPTEFSRMVVLDWVQNGTFSANSTVPLPAHLEGLDGFGVRSPPSAGTWRQLATDVEHALVDDLMRRKPGARLPQHKPPLPQNLRSTLRSHHVVLISREGSRAFPREHEARLAALFATVTARRIVGYTGRESALATVRIFAVASGVFAYHGAGLVNVLFALVPLCVVEVSTLMRDDSDDVALECNTRSRQDGGAHEMNTTQGAQGGAAAKTMAAIENLPSNGTSGNSTLRNRSHSISKIFQPWRSNRQAICPWNPLVHWQTYYLSVSEMLHANPKVSRHLRTRYHCTHLCCRVSFDTRPLRYAHLILILRTEASMLHVLVHTSAHDARTSPHTGRLRHGSVGREGFCPRFAFEGDETYYLA